jgi:putative molybdopterin biosynthesis protein
MKREQGEKATVGGKEWLTIAEVQRVLGLGRTKTYDLVARGEIPAIRIGRVLRVNPEELDRWLETKRVVDPAER